MEKCLFGTEEVEIPSLLTANYELMKDVLNMDTWNNSLNDSQRQHLMKFLPFFPTDNSIQQLSTVEKVLSGEDLKFGSPLRHFYNKLRDGSYTPEIVQLDATLDKIKRKENREFQRNYYYQLLKDILINRQRIFDTASVTPMNEPMNFESFVSRKPPSNKSQVSYRVKCKMKQIMKEVRNECSILESSDEDCSNDGEVGEPITSVTPVQSTLNSTDDSSLSIIYKRIVAPNHVTTEDFHSMLRRHKKRRLENEESPDLDTRDVELNQIIEKTHLGVKKKAKEKEVKRQYDGNDFSDVDDRLPIDDDTGLKDPGMHCNFFSLIRDIIYQEKDHCISTSKLEDSISEWLNTDISSSNSWIQGHTNWVLACDSALNFLSGNFIGSFLPNFIPYIESHKNGDFWVWVGSGRDLDSDLQPLFNHWLLNKESMMEDILDFPVSSPPPPLYPTDYKVRPSSEIETLEFRKQETLRYENPHKSFIYKMHGYTAVVGPLKGVFRKESLQKARDHILLVSNRPAFVTLLTLVRDAAARLPNGEGTRADVCELLKDSQFLCPDVSDGQINTVVSGALDRLHYEKDPCIKYISGRKSWVYLHRGRTFDELEKIHRAAAVAIQAKRSLKNKLGKKGKEMRPEEFKRNLLISEMGAGKIADTQDSIIMRPESTMKTKKQYTPLKVDGPFPGFQLQTNSSIQHMDKFINEKPISLLGQTIDSPKIIGRTASKAKQRIKMENQNVSAQRESSMFGKPSIRRSISHPSFKSAASIISTTCANNSMFSSIPTLSGSKTLTNMPLQVSPKDSKVMNSSLELSVCTTLSAFSGTSVMSVKSGPAVATTDLLASANSTLALTNAAQPPIIRFAKPIQAIGKSFTIATAPPSIPKNHSAVNQISLQSVLPVTTATVRSVNPMTLQLSAPSTPSKTPKQVNSQIQQLVVSGGQTTILVDKTMLVNSANMLSQPTSSAVLTLRGSQPTVRQILQTSSSASISSITPPGLTRTGITVPKSIIIGGKNVQLSGKPVQLIGQQLVGQPTISQSVTRISQPSSISSTRFNLVTPQGVLSTLNINNQATSAPASVSISNPTLVSHILKQGGTVVRQNNPVLQQAAKTLQQANRMTTVQQTIKVAEAQPASLSLVTNANLKLVSKPVIGRVQQSAVGQLKVVESGLQSATTVLKPADSSAVISQPVSSFTIKPESSLTGSLVRTISASTRPNILSCTKPHSKQVNLNQVTVNKISVNPSIVKQANVTTSAVNFTTLAPVVTGQTNTNQINVSQQVSNSSLAGAKLSQIKFVQQTKESPSLTSQMKTQQHQS